MSPTGIHVIVIGGGLGGLCLAQGLKKAGINVAVYERDRTPSDRLQGYRIHIEPQGNQALAACLPADLFAQYVATSGPGGNGFRISTDQLKELCFFRAPAPPREGDSAKLDLSVSRITLRQILLAGLEEVVYFDKTFTGYEELPDGKIKACFADGTSAIGDVLVGADGGKSWVRKQFLPQAQVVATGVVAIMGKLPLTDEVRQLLMPGQFDGATSVLGPKGHALFIAIHDHLRCAGGDHEVGAKPHRGIKPPVRANGSGSKRDAVVPSPQDPLLDDLHDYVFWALIARKEKYAAGEALQQLDGAALYGVVQEMIQGWHPRLQQLVIKADPATIIAKPLNTSTPLKPWVTRQVTLIGDAIHSMPPTRGIGGNTALRDAQLLTERLIAVKVGETPLLQAIHDYEAEMIKYASAAVRDSMQALHMHVADSRLFAKVLLRSMNALFALQRALRL